MPGPTPTEKVARHLAGTIAGEVRTDLLTRSLYATDGSLFEILPVAVAFPRSAEDVVKAVRFCGAERIPLLPRGGGTSLAGQTVGEAVVLDFTKHMNRVVSVDPGGRTCVVEPGVVLARLNAALAEHGLKFAPDPASAAQCAVGGMIGNNSTGCRSLVYDKTDGYLRTLDLVLADGRTISTRPAPWGEGEEPFASVGARVRESRDVVLRSYPDIQRNVSGYNLRGALGGEDLNPARLIAGSEGTLAVVTGATLDLVAVPARTETLMLFYRTLDDALRDVPVLLEERPAVVELMDRVLFDLAARHPAYERTVAAFPGGCGAALLVEFDGPDDAAVRLPGDRVRAARSGGRRGCLEALRAEDPAQRGRYWALRKAGLPILGSSASDAKHLEFVEDTAVPAARLPEYVEAFQGILRRHGTSAAFWAHAGPGCLHVRPLVNPRTVEGSRAMLAIATEVADLARAHGGTVSGEHGDGLLRTQFIRRLYGPEVADLLAWIKDRFDPARILNPGKVVAPDADMTRHHRSFASPGATAPASATSVDFSRHVDIAHSAELCHGCGGCRSREPAGVMCPTFRVTGDEIQSPRGRANLMRLAMAGRIPESLHGEVGRAAVDLCVGCGACARECPSGVDIGRLRVAWKERENRERGTPLAARAVAGLAGWRGRPAWLRAAAGATCASLPGRWAAAALLGTDPARPIPAMRARTFARLSGAPGSPADATVALWVDCFTDLFEPENGVAALDLLRASGERVAVFAGGCCGRSAWSVGCVQEARSQARDAARMLSAVEIPVVTLEPSCAAMMSREWEGLGIAPASNVKDVVVHLAGLRGTGFGVRVAGPGLRGSSPSSPRVVHDHCHARASGWGGAVASGLDALGVPSSTSPAGCCGMAGFFGYERRHRDLSAAIGREAASRIPPGSEVGAAGFSCRTQLSGLLGRPVVHPVRWLRGMIPPGGGAV